MSTSHRRSIAIHQPPPPAAPWARHSAMADADDIIMLSPSNSSSTSTPEKLPRRLKVTFNASTTTHALAKANRSLSAFQPRQALSEYTEILKTWPGHPVAFLNRCLCYLVLGFPHLAVFDAYRAFLAASAIQSRHADEISGRSNLYNLHLYTEEADSAVDSWRVEPTCYIARGTFGFLDNGLAGICVMPAHRDPLPDDLKKNTPMERKVQEYLVRDVLMKAQYRLAVSLWKCGGGAWQSAMDIICEAESLAYFHDEDKQYFRALHNQILREIEDVMKEEEAIRHFFKTEKGWTPPMLMDHKNAGIHGLLQSRFTRKPLELYPWDKDSITWANEPAQAVGELNDGMADVGVYPCHYILRMEDGFNKAPILSLTADKAFDASEVVFAERSALQVVLPANGLLYCNNCGAALNVPEGPLAVAAVSATVRGQLLTLGLTRDLDPPDRTITSSPSTIENMDNSSMSGRNELKEGENDHMKQSGDPPFTDNQSRRQEGYQICNGCRKVAFCSSRCMDRAIYKSHHFFLCKTSAHASSYSVSPPNTWPIPDPKYTVLLNRLVERTIGFAMGTVPTLAQHWVRVLQGNIGSPRELLKNQDTDNRSWPWDKAKSVSIQELYPRRETLANITQSYREKERKDSKLDHDYSPLVATEEREYLELDENTPNTTPGVENLLPLMMDWSFENNVRFPLRVIHEVFHRQCSKTALRALLDITLFDGWMLETIRAKVEGNMRIQRLPKLEILFDNEGKVASRNNYKQQVVESAYGQPLFGSDNDQWMASLHPLCSGIREAGPDETPNIRLFDRDGALVVSAIKRIEAGDVLLC